MRRKMTKAFTLPAVLITLAIICVVAALTIPTLMQNYKKKVYGTRLKEYYSIMSQAIQLSEIDHGPKSGWSKHALSENYDEEGNLDNSAAHSYNYEFFKTYIAPYLKYTSESIKDNGTFKLVNGTRVEMWNGDCVDMTVDVNGDKGPKQGGVDLFYFNICLTSKNYVNAGYSCDKYTREECVQKCKENYAYCTSLLQRDNWEFKDDYPYTLK